MASIGTNIKRFRLRSGLSQEQLAERVGKTRSAISQYESGKIVPRMGVIEDLASVFLVDKMELLETGEKSSSLTEDEQELLFIYRQVDPDERELILAHAKMVLVHVRSR